MSTAANANRLEATDLADVFAEIEALAWQIDRDGVAGAPTEAVDHLLLMARAAKGSPVLSEVLADPTEPPAVRERAFGLLAMQIISSLDDPHLTLAA